jgi:hypothetical protein
LCDTAALDLGKHLYARDTSNCGSPSLIGASIVAPSYAAMRRGRDVGERRPDHFITPSARIRTVNPAKYGDGDDHRDHGGEDRTQAFRRGPSPSPATTRRSPPMPPQMMMAMMLLRISSMGCEASRSIRRAA